jgi:hypothetical protein
MYLPFMPTAPVIEFSVSVPVLSVQITLALAIVSHDPRMRTRGFVFNIRLVVKANASVTANGRPTEAIQSQKKL